jgi:hypothetical protein
VPLDWRVSRKVIWSPTCRAPADTVCPPLVTVAPLASMVRVHPSAVFSESSVPLIPVIVMPPAMGPPPGPRPIPIGPMPAPNMPRPGAAHPAPGAGAADDVSGTATPTGAPPAASDRPGRTAMPNAVTPTSATRAAARMGTRGPQRGLLREVSSSIGLWLLDGKSSMRTTGRPTSTGMPPKPEPILNGPDTHPALASRTPAPGAAGSHAVLRGGRCVRVRAHRHFRGRCRNRQSNLWRFLSDGLDDRPWKGRGIGPPVRPAPRRA